jgi:hypothetical protein
MNLLKEREKQVLSRLKAVAFTDSVHSVYPQDPPGINSALGIANVQRYVNLSCSMQ